MLLVSSYRYGQFCSKKIGCMPSVSWFWYYYVLPSFGISWNYIVGKVNACAICWRIFLPRLSTKIFVSIFRDFFDFEFRNENINFIKYLRLKFSLKKESKNVVESLSTKNCQFIKYLRLKFSLKKESKNVVESLSTKNCQFIKYLHLKFSLKKESKNVVESLGTKNCQ